MIADESTKPVAPTTRPWLRYWPNWTQPGPCFPAPNCASSTNCPPATAPSPRFH